MKISVGDLVSWEGWWYLVEGKHTGYLSVSFLGLASDGGKEIKQVTIFEEDVNDVIKGWGNRDEAYNMIDVLERFE